MEQIYPDNSHEQRKKHEKVITGSTVKKKPSLGQKIGELFRVEGIDSLPEYVIDKVVLPEIKSGVHSVLSAAIDAFFQDKSGRRNYISSSSSAVPVTRISYDKMYGQKNSQTVQYVNPNSNRTVSGVMKYNDWIFQSKGDADAVLEGLLDSIDVYKAAKVSDFYDLIGQPSEYTEDNYGWTELGEAKIVRCGADGWKLVLPRATVLDR